MSTSGPNVSSFIRYSKLNEQVMAHKNRRKQLQQELRENRKHPTLVTTLRQFAILREIEELEQAINKLYVDINKRKPAKFFSRVSSHDPVVRKFIEACSDLDTFANVLRTDPSIREEKDSGGHSLFYHLANLEVFFTEEEYKKLSSSEKNRMTEMRSDLLEIYAVDMKLEELMREESALGSFYNVTQYVTRGPAEMECFLVLLNKANELGFDFNSNNGFMILKNIAFHYSRIKGAKRVGNLIAELFKIAPGLRTSVVDDPNYYSTPLSMAVSTGCIDMISVLLDQGAIPAPKTMRNLIKQIQKNIPKLTESLENGRYPQGFTRKYTKRCLEAWRGLPARIDMIVKGLAESLKNGRYPQEFTREDTEQCIAVWRASPLHKDDEERPNNHVPESDEPVARKVGTYRTK